MKYLRFGVPFDIDVLHVIDGIQYPVGWFYDPDNRAAFYLEEVEEAPVEPVKNVPPMVTRRQARQALLLKGLLDSVVTSIASLDDGTPEGKQRSQLAMIEWEDSLNFERHRPLVIQIGMALGLDEDGLDDLFIFAATL